MKEKIKIIIPLGGVGRRFMECGYARPKPIIRALGKEIIFWLLDSLRISGDHQVFMPYNEELDSFNFSRIVSSRHHKVQMLSIPPTRGASETIKKCIDHFGIEGRVAVMDGDTWYEEDIIEKIEASSGNVLTCFKSDDPEPIYSYVVEDNGLVKDIQEKKKISNLANSGCYVFDDAKKLSNYIGEMNLDVPTETYTSQVISKMLACGESFKVVNVDKFHILGTPEQVINFSKTHPNTSKRFCFDLDNTLVTSPKNEGDYSTVEPIPETIKYLRKLHDAGHSIIIYTARRMRTHSGNVGKVLADIGSITIDTLSKFAIPYDELHFGKPYAHFYIDDLMVSPYSDLNKELGFYLENVNPRSFNEIERGKTFKKRSKNLHKLHGEAHYYQWVSENCSCDVKDMFPKLVSHKDGELEIEMVEGVNFSMLYLNQVLKEDSLGKLIYSLKKLHEKKEHDTIFYSYANFWSKVSDRLSMYDHKEYELPEKTITEVKEKLSKIESQGFCRVMIHGDPVFSNIFLDLRGKIKFVDMRGVEENKLTVFGHELYDFAKVYQSLCGYDEVLLEKSVSLSYKRSMIRFFESHFDEETMNKIRVITSSLLLSLVPLHDDKAKCIKYIDIAKRLI